MSKVTDINKPFMLSTASDDSPARRNRAGTIERTDKYKNIDDGLTPFRSTNSNYGNNKSAFDIRDAVILCQKCYYNFAIFRNIIDLMTEFSVNNIYYRGGSTKSQDFFRALFNKINLWDLQDQFFREYYRSGNVFIYRFDTEIMPADVNRITQVFGDVESPISVKVNIEKRKIPSRYIILNPADLQMGGIVNFAQGLYYKKLTQFEVSQLKNPKTDEDKDVFNALPKEAQDAIKQGVTSVIIPLDRLKTAMVFYKKQDYEPFAVPMGYPVLEDISFKAELKKIDMAIARTMQQIILLVTAGESPKNDGMGVNQKYIEELRNLFKNPSVGRVLVADYTTEAKFVIPEIAELLDPKKYEIINNDINIGLNNVFMGGEKFANQSQKVELFVARLEQGRKAFLNNFLIPEIKRIAKSLGFQNYPTPYFEDIELKDNIEYAKIYAHLIEIGVLTPEEGLKAIETNTLPDPAIMQDDQKVWKSQRDAGLYEPLVGAPKDPAGAGRPTGTPSKKKVSPIRGEEKYSLTKIKENLSLAQELQVSVEKEVKRQQNLKKLSKLQKEVVSQISDLIIANEEPDKWNSSIASYIESPQDKNKQRIDQVLAIAAEHDVSPYLAGIMLASKIPKEE